MRRRVFVASTHPGGMPPGPKRGGARKSRTNFFSLILMGPIPFFLTFHSELKKVQFGLNRPRIADSRGNLSFGGDDVQGQGGGAAAAKSRKIFF